MSDREGSWAVAGKEAWAERSKEPRKVGRTGGEAFPKLSSSLFTVLSLFPIPSSLLSWLAWSPGPLDFLKRDYWQFILNTTHQSSQLKRLLKFHGAAISLNVLSLFQVAPTELAFHVSIVFSFDHQARLRTQPSNKIFLSKIKHFGSFLVLRFRQLERPTSKLIILRRVFLSSHQGEWWRGSLYTTRFYHAYSRPHCSLRAGSYWQRIRKRKRKEPSVPM